MMDAATMFAGFMQSAFFFWGLFWSPLVALVAFVGGWVYNFGTSRVPLPISATHHELDGLLTQLESSLKDRSDQGCENSAAILRQVRSQIYHAPKTPIPAGDKHQLIRAEVLTSTAVTGAKNYDPKAARQIFDGMAAKPRPWLVSLIGRVFRWSAVQLFPVGIRVHIAELEKAKAVIATKPAPVILIPTHKSHMDYLTIHYICTTYGMQLPCAVAGDNLNVPILGAILRSCGAIFIRRSFGGDALYGAIFSEYLKHLLRDGQSLECFIEGARSRSGKLLPPKLGFLKCILDAVQNGDAEDAWLLPISLAYDRMVETESYIDELQGSPKKAERLMTILHAYIHLMRSAFQKTSCYGRVDVGFGAPISVREHLEHWKYNASAETLLWNFETNSLERKPRSPAEQNAAVLRSLAYRALTQCNACTTILPTALVGTVLLSHVERGLHFDELVQKVKWLQDQIKLRGGKVIEDASLPESVSLVVNRIMAPGGRNHLVKRHRDLLITALFNPEERLELSLFRNQLMHVFVLESIMAVSASNISRNMGPVFHPRDVLEKGAFLSYLLKMEFVYECIFHDFLDAVTDSNGNLVLAHSFNEMISLFLQRGLFKDEGDGQLSLGFDDDRGKSSIDYLCGLLLPFVDSYFLVILGCFQLLPDATADEKEFISQIQLLGERLYFCGQLDFYESIGRETLQTAVQRYHQVGVLQYVEVFGKHRNSKMLRLAPRFHQEEALQELLEQLHAYRLPHNQMQRLPDLIAAVPRAVCA